MRKLVLLLLLVAGLGHAPLLLAATCTSSASGNWNDGTKWTGLGTCTTSGPVAGDAAIVTGGFNMTINAAGLGAASIALGQLGAGNNGTLTFNSGSSLTVSGVVTMGNGTRTGNIDMTAGGTLTLASFTYNAGTFTPGAGTVVLTGTSTLPNNATLGTFNNLTINSGGRSEERRVGKECRL